MSVPKTIPWLALLAVAATLGCKGPSRSEGEGTAQHGCGPVAGSLGNIEGNASVSAPAYSGVKGALLATRFRSLEEFKTVVGIEYASNPDGATADSGGASRVRLCHCSNGVEVVSVLESGISQDDIMEVAKGGFMDRVGLVFRAPYAVANRADLERVYVLARRLPQAFAVGDPSFYDLAERSVANIDTEDLAFRHAGDTTEKGYINSFNHITAQAFISSIFSEELADLVADLHERKNMRELTTGKFTEDQLTSLDNNPVDNYVDMVNNEWGQELGMELKEKYGISRETWWTPELLASYLNDIQSYYSWAFQIGFKPFRPEDDLVVRFADKLNVVMRKRYG